MELQSEQNEIKMNENSTTNTDGKNGNHDTVINNVLKSNAQKIYLQKLELIKVEEKLTQIKLLQNKAIIIANEKKLKYKENQELLKKYHISFAQTITPYLKTNLSSEIETEVTKKKEELNKCLEDLSVSLANKNEQIEKFRSDLKHLNENILLQKKRKNATHLQLQKTLQDTRQVQMKAEKILRELRSNNVK